MIMPLIGVATVKKTIMCVGLTLIFCHNPFVVLLSPSKRNNVRGFPVLPKTNPKTKLCPHANNVIRTPPPDPPPMVQRFIIYSLVVN